MGDTYTQIYIHVIFAVDHAKKSFRAEYLQLLEKFGAEYDQRYIFKFVGD